MKKVTTSMLLWDAQVTMLATAASRKGMNVSEYFREVVVPLVAQNAGLEVPRVPNTARRSPSSGTYAVDVDALAKAVVEQLRRASGGRA